MISPAIVGVSPFETPDVELVENLGKAGALAILDLGRETEIGRKALAALQRNRMPSFGVRINRLETFTTTDLNDRVTTLILDAADLLQQDHPGKMLDTWKAPQRKI